jgi:starch synthase
MAKKPTSKKAAVEEKTAGKTTKTTTKRAGAASRKIAASQSQPPSQSQSQPRSRSKPTSRADTRAEPGSAAAPSKGAPQPRQPAEPHLHSISAGQETAALRPMPQVHAFAPAAAAAPPQPRAQRQPQPVPEPAPQSPEPTGPPPGPPPAVPPVSEPAPTPEPLADSGYEPETQPHPQPQQQPPPPPAEHRQRPSLFIVHITPEMAPVAKVGGLADVVFGLSRELAIRGNHVEIILPKYDTLRYDHIFELHEVYRDLWVPWYEGAIHCTVLFGFVHSRKCFFIEPHSQDNFFNRGSIYGFADDVLRYAFFSRAALEFLWKAGKHPDILHCHDWQTALVPVFLYEIYQQLGMSHPRACLTIHNFKHQGVTGAELLHATGLHQPQRFFDLHRMGDNRHKDALNLLKAGVVYSNFVTTVSPRYAFETKDDGQGFGLEPTLHTHHMKYGGVVNGIDYDVWNPEIDHHLAARYGVDDIDAKYDNKRALRHRLMLADNEKPIVAFVGRLDPQKGLELVRHAIFYALERGAQFVLLGSSPYQDINNDFWGLKHMLNESPDCHLEIGFDDELAHLIYAGADIMLVPSQFEPCGLTQLIALHYGTIPVVRTVGGLADTVFDKDYSDRPLHERNGYRFDNYDAPGLESALGRAIDCYYQFPEHFRELMKNAMRADYSWNWPGQDYLNIYDFIRDR